MNPTTIKYCRWLHLCCAGNVIVLTLLLDQTHL